MTMESVAMPVMENGFGGSRPVSEQLSYIKKLGAMMMLSNRLYKDHVVSFCGTLIKFYNNLNSSSIKVEELKD